MRDTELNIGIALDGVLKIQAKPLCIVLDEDIVNGLERLRDTMGFPIETMLSQSLRQFINAFLPIADLHEQGKLSLACIPDLQHAVESLTVKIDVATTRIDKNFKNLDRQNKTGLLDKR